MIEALEEIDELDNTVILVTSDNGMPFPRSKGQLYDAGTRVPLAVRWGDQVKAGRVVEDFISFTDFAPTFLELADTRANATSPTMTGRSFLDVLLSDASGRVDPSRDHAVTGRERYYPELLPYPCRAIRTDSHLYIRNYEPTRNPGGAPPRFRDLSGGASRQAILGNRNTDEGRWYYDLTAGLRPQEELYDLGQDPWQMHNVVSDLQYRHVMGELADRLNDKLVRDFDPRALGRGEVFDNYPARVWNSVTHRALPGLAP